MVTLTTPTRRNPEAPVIDPEAGLISPAIVADILVAEEMAVISAPVRGDNLLVKMFKSVVAVYDFLSGPPMTKRERIRREIAEANRGVELNRIDL